jgi:ATP-dependent Clp protease ATP-binding subunit ClpX
MRERNTDCSFCRKSYRDVGPLVEGPGEVYICGECIELCQSIIDQEKRRRGRPGGSLPPETTPEAIRGGLDQLVAGQHEAKEALVLAALRRCESSGLTPPSPVLLIGPTRSSNEAPPQTDEACSGFCLYKRLRSIVRGLLAQPQLLDRSRR